jgi:Taurine catabolism dioxygenase TauD, TfdA family
VPATRGGETPIADSRRVLARIPPSVAAVFREKGVMYVRNFDGVLDLSWQQAFHSNDPQEVESICRTGGLQCDWRKDGRLRTTQVCHATAFHPTTGEEVWFNQAHLFHVSSLPQATREALLSAVPESELPRQAYYGDGSPLEAALLDEIRAAYQAEAMPVLWQAGDMLLLDNMLVAHGRNHFQGDRRILVGMAAMRPATGERSCER